MNAYIEILCTDMELGGQLGEDDPAVEAQAIVGDADMEPLVQPQAKKRKANTQDAHCDEDNNALAKQPEQPNAPKKKKVATASVPANCADPEDEVQRKADQDGGNNGASAAKSKSKKGGKRSEKAQGGKGKKKAREDGLEEAMIPQRKEGTKNAKGKRGRAQGTDEVAEDEVPPPGKQKPKKAEGSRAKDVEGSSKIRKDNSSRSENQPTASVEEPAASPHEEAAASTEEEPRAYSTRFRGVNQALVPDILKKRSRR